MREQLKKIFPVTCTHLSAAGCSDATDALVTTDACSFVEQLSLLAEAAEVPAYLPDLARAERARHELNEDNRQIPLERPVDAIAVNPTLLLVEVGWQPLLQLLDGANLKPEPSPQMLLFWQHPVSVTPEMKSASPAELLALKIVTEQLEPVEIAASHDRPVGVIDAAVDSAVRQGLLLAPPSKLRRDTSKLEASAATTEAFIEAEVFTLQWHITHRCDLHCRHCYDRSDRKDVESSQGLEILDQMRRFCRDHHVGGQVSFSGGNPFLHPDFLTLYQAAHERNLNLAILGNPASEAHLDAILQIAEPAFFQISLEGLEEHNDHIRGKGSYQSVLEFLDLLKKKKIYSMVMLTLTRANLDQVLPLAEILRDRVDLFTYNRLAMVGEGANLEAPQAEEYHRFVIDYLKARNTNPIMAIKDSLINIELEKQQHNLFGGCTGFGCGAAFNFVSLLPDGQVHACRKLPSLIGNLNRQTLHEIYHSYEAENYRQGCHECSACHLRLVCGGCLAVNHGWGRDPFQERDPDCFIK
ncbi:MAG: thio(seleno)oxazole modification radical SAM maturase SbtM [Desulfuromonadales bacterium]